MMRLFQIVFLIAFGVSLLPWQASEVPQAQAQAVTPNLTAAPHHCYQRWYTSGTWPQYVMQSESNCSPGNPAPSAAASSVASKPPSEPWCIPKSGKVCAESDGNGGTITCQLYFPVNTVAFATNAHYCVWNFNAVGRESRDIFCTLYHQTNPGHYVYNAGKNDFDIVQKPRNETACSNWVKEEDRKISTSPPLCLPDKSNEYLCNTTYKEAQVTCHFNSQSVAPDFVGRYIADDYWCSLQWPDATPTPCPKIPSSGAITISVVHDPASKKRAEEIACAIPRLPVLKNLGSNLGVTLISAPGLVCRQDSLVPRSPVCNNDYVASVAVGQYAVVVTNQATGGSATGSIAIVSGQTDLIHELLGHVIANLNDEYEIDGLEINELRQYCSQPIRGINTVTVPQLSFASDGAAKDALANLVPWVRMNFVLPTTPVTTNGVLGTPPTMGTQAGMYNSNRCGPIQPVWIPYQDSFMRSMTDTIPPYHQKAIEAGLARWLVR